jgi:hypothetical protein
MKKVTLVKRSTLQKERTDYVVLIFVQHFDKGTIIKMIADQHVGVCRLSGDGGFVVGAAEVVLKSTTL